MLSSTALISLASLVSLPSAQDLETELLALTSEALAEAARTEGDAARGAVVFYQPELACTRCHVAGAARWGPT